MKSAIALAFSAAGLASAQAVVDFDVIFSAAPEFATIKPVRSSTTNTASVASSITAKLLAAHSSNKPLSTLTSQKPLGSTSKIAKATAVKKTSTKLKTTKKATKAKTTVKKKTTKAKTQKKPQQKVKKPTKKLQKTAKKQPKPAKKHARRHAAIHEKRQAASSSSISSSTSCASQVILYSYVPSVDTPTSFLTDTGLSGFSRDALAPAGLTRQFSQAYGSLLANNYLGYYQLSSYNIRQCAALCTAYPGCTAINTYFERDPVVDPGVNCKNPASGTSVRCALWGSTISAAQALNIGEWRADFMVVVQGSNGYTLNTPPPQQTNFTGPVALAGAISTSAGTSFISTSFQAGAYDVSFCAAACQSTTQNNWNTAIATRNSSFVACNYFNAFKVSYNGSDAGTYCKLYTDSSVASNANQYTQTASSGVTYDLTYSYGYSLTANNSGYAPVNNGPAPVNLTASCAQLAGNGSSFVDSNSITYTVKCGYDVLGAGDIGNVAVNSFANCFAACDAKPGCQALVFAGTTGRGTCYFKSLNNVSQQPNVNDGTQLAWLPGYYPAFEKPATKTTSAAPTSSTK